MKVWIRACFINIFASVVYLSSGAVSRVDVSNLHGSKDHGSHSLNRFMHKANPHERTPEQLEKQVEAMARRVERMGKDKVAKHLEAEVEQVRSNLCLQQGFRAHEQLPCEMFMRQACGPSFLREHNRKPGEKPVKAVSAASCQYFFQEKQLPSVAGAINSVGAKFANAIDDVGNEVDAEVQERKQQKVAEKQEALASVPGCTDQKWTSKSGKDCADYALGNLCTPRGKPGDGWLSDWGDFEDDKKDGLTAADACCVCGGGSLAGAAPSPVPAGSPGPAPGAPSGLQDNFHALGKQHRPLQEQGVMGDLVMHEDENTMLEDWRNEFGPNSGQSDIKTICAKNPDNEWCRLNGYYEKERPKKKSGSSRVTVSSALLILALPLCFQLAEWA